MFHGSAAILNDFLKPGAALSQEQKRDSLSHADRLAQTKRPVNLPCASVH